MPKEALVSVFLSRLSCPCPRPCSKLEIGTSLLSCKRTLAYTLTEPRAPARLRLGPRWRSPRRRGWPRLLAHAAGSPRALRLARRLLHAILRNAPTLLPASCVVPHSAKGRSARRCTTSRPCVHGGCSPLGTLAAAHCHGEGTWHSRSSDSIIFGRS